MEQAHPAACIIAFAFPPRSIMATFVEARQTHKSTSILEHLAHHWFLIFLTFFGLWVWIPWLAPIAMHVGWDKLAKGIYSIYQFFCHQLPERSFFLFGSKPMYSLAEIEAAGKSVTNTWMLRS